MTRPHYVPHGSAIQGVLRDISDAGGSMDYDEFRRCLARHYSTVISMNDAMQLLRRRSLVQKRIHLTASGSAKLIAAEERKPRKAAQ